jgi:hypothetical protein
MSHVRKNDEQAVYQIKVRGILDERRSDWFDGLAITPQVNGTTLITGPVRDQAALHGLLAKVRDMGQVLLSVRRVDAASLTEEQSA